jgi:hypothetical protein
MSDKYLLSALAAVSTILLIVIAILLGERPSKLHFPGGEPTGNLQYIERNR